MVHQSHEAVSVNDVDVENAAAPAVTTSTPALTGGSAEQQITNLLQENSVVLISKTTCPFCIGNFTGQVHSCLTIRSHRFCISLTKFSFSCSNSELKGTLVSYGIKFAILEIDTSSNCAEIQAYLLAKTRIATVPILFVGGEVVGGCMDVKSMEHSGVFRTKLAPYLGNAKVAVTFCMYVARVFVTHTYI